MPRARNICLALLLVGAGCGDGPAAPDPGVREGYALHLLDLPATITGPSHTFQMALRNRGTDTLRVRAQHTSTGFDFEVRRPGGALLWHRTQGHAEIDQPWPIELAPQQQWVFSEVWKLGGDDGRPLPPGDYEVRGRLTLVEPTDTVWTRAARFRLE